MQVANNFSSSPSSLSTANTNNKSIKTDIELIELIQLIRLKSEKGFHILYEKYSAALYGILVKFVLNKEIADDLLQDTFVKIWKHIDGFDSSRGTLFTWMLNIARNQAIDYLRSSSYKSQSLNVNIDLYTLHLEYKNSNNVSEIEVKDFKNKALHQLPPKYVEVIDLILFYGCTHEQTAQILKLPLGTVKTRIRKGLNTLKILYNQ